jgi:surfactin synthase thioesterase subunit
MNRASKSVKKQISSKWQYQLFEHITIFLFILKLTVHHEFAVLCQHTLQSLTHVLCAILDIGQQLRTWQRHETVKEHLTNLGGEHPYINNYVLPIRNSLSTKTATVNNYNGTVIRRTCNIFIHPINTDF